MARSVAAGSVDPQEPRWCTFDGWHSQVYYPICDGKSPVYFGIRYLDGSPVWYCTKCLGTKLTQKTIDDWMGSKFWEVIIIECGEHCNRMKGHEGDCAWLDI